MALGFELTAKWSRAIRPVDNFINFYDRNLQQYGKTLGKCPLRATLESLITIVKCLKEWPQNSCPTLGS